MRTSSVGATSNLREAGITLIELLIVMTLIALLAGISYPAMSGGLDSLRLRSAADGVAAFLATAVDRAERRQQAIELVISPAENSLTARSSDMGFTKKLDVTAPVHIEGVEPALPNVAPGDPANLQPRRFLIYPGGTAPHVAIELATQDGRHRRVSLDPLSGFPKSEVVAP